MVVSNVPRHRRRSRLHLRALPPAGPDVLRRRHATLTASPDDWEAQFGLSRPTPPTARSTPTSTAAPTPRNALDQTHPRGLYTRYLAEGATGSFFATRVALANPGAMPARVLFRFFTQAGVARARTSWSCRRRRAAPSISSRCRAWVPPMCRRSSNPTPKSSSTGRCAGTRRVVAGAHAEGSVPAPALRWYLAEGATHGSFDLFYLIQNPSLTRTASVRIRFLRPAGPADRAVLSPCSRTAAPRSRGRHPGAGGHRRLGGDREPERAAAHRRAGDVLVGGRRVRRRPRQRRRDRAVDSSGSSPREPPARSSTLPAARQPERHRRR